MLADLRDGTLAKHTLAAKAKLFEGGLNALLPLLTVCNERHLTRLSWMVTRLLLNQTVYFSHWQHRCKLWLAKERIDAEAPTGRW